MVELAGEYGVELEQELGPMLEVVNGGPSVYARPFNPAALVAATNKLRSLGKDRALEVLGSYIKISLVSVDGVRPEDLRGIGLDRAKAELIMRMLFLRRPEAPIFPSMKLGLPLPGPSEESTEEWPLFPIKRLCDIPFLIPLGYIGRRGRQSATALVDYCKKYCDVRGGDIGPVSEEEIETALTDLFRSKAWKALFDPERSGWEVEERLHREYLREQYRLLVASW